MHVKFIPDNSLKGPGKFQKSIYTIFASDNDL